MGSQLFDLDGFIKDGLSRIQHRIDYSPCFPAFTGVGAICGRPRRAPTCCGVGRYSDRVLGLADTATQQE